MNLVLINCSKAGVCIIQISRYHKQGRFRYPDIAERYLVDPG